MSELSPAAEAVLDAYRSSHLSINNLAAALRSAAEQLENLYCDGDVEDSPGIVFALRQLMLIANELEAQ